MKYIAQHCCDKTVNDKTALYRECFPNCTRLRWIRLLSQVLEGAIASIAPPAATWQSFYILRPVGTATTVWRWLNVKGTFLRMHHTTFQACRRIAQQAPGGEGRSPALITFERFSAGWFRERGTWFGSIHITGRLFGRRASGRFPLPCRCRRAMGLGLCRRHCGNVGRNCCTPLRNVVVRFVRRRSMLRVGSLRSVSVVLFADVRNIGVGRCVLVTERFWRNKRGGSCRDISRTHCCCTNHECFVRVTYRKQKMQRFLNVGSNPGLKRCD